MNYEHQKIQATLKLLMKKKKATYQSIGRTLRISPATVKRRLNGDSITVQQLTAFANALSVSFYELIELSKRNTREPHLFTEEQEELLASDLNLMRLFRLVLAGQAFSEIKAHIGGSEAVLRKRARQLEQAKLAQLLPGDRFVPIVQFPVRWREGGKLRKTYELLLSKNLAQRITRPGGSPGMNQRFELALSPESYQAFCQDIEKTYLKYRGISEIHLSAPIDLQHLVSGIFFIDQFSIWDG